MAGYQTGKVTVTTAATLIASIGAAPDTDGLLVTASAACFVGGAGVTAATGYPLAASTPATIPTTGAEPLALYGITSTGTSDVSFIYPG